MNIKDQIDLLQRASQESGKFDNRELVVPPASGELTIGYCKDSECRAKAGRAMGCEPFVSYHCIYHLAKYIVQCRKNSDGFSVAVCIGQNTRVIGNIEPIVVELIDGVAYVSGMQIPSAIWQPGTADNELILRVPEGICNKRAGIWRGQIFGRWWCKNVYLGRCYSMNPKYKPDDFMSRSSLPGMRAWKEIVTDGPKKSLIAVREYCSACGKAFRYSKSEGKKGLNFVLDTFSGPPKFKEIIQNLLDQLKKTTDELTSLRAETLRLKLELLTLGLKE